MFTTDFLLTSLIVILIPGTGVIYTVSTGLFLGRRSSIGAAFGCTMGIVPHLLASTLGLSAILHMSALTFHVLKYAGSAYLLYLAWIMWRERGVIKLNRPDKNSLFQIALKGFLINILNPKLSIFFLAFLPLFVSSKAAFPILQMLVLSAVFMAMTLIIFIFYGILAGNVSAYFIRSPKVITWLQRSFAAVFAALATKLAQSEP